MSEETSPGQSPAELVIVLGGDPVARAAVIEKRLEGRQTPALLLTASPQKTESSEQPDTESLVEVRADNPTERVAAWRSGAVDAGDPVHAALSIGPDSPLSALTLWEYVRRAVAAGFWSTVVVELDGIHAAARTLSSVGALGAFVDTNWPVNHRYAAMAAGDNVDPRLKEAHRIATTVAEVETMLAGDVEVLVAVDGPETVAHARMLVDLARGGARLELTGSVAEGFVARIPAPADPGGEPQVVEARLVTDVDGVPIVVHLPAVLSRCRLESWEREGDDLVARFTPNPDLWPQHLIDGVSRRSSG